MEAEIERLHLSIDGLAETVSGLHGDLARQAEKLEQVSARQISDFKELLTKLYDTHRALADQQRGAFDGFGDRLDKLLARQEEQAIGLRSEMKTDFARIVDRQDSQFRWLVGLLIASAISVGLTIYRAH